MNIQLMGDPHRGASRGAGGAAGGGATAAGRARPGVTTARRGVTPAAAHSTAARGGATLKWLSSSPSGNHVAPCLSRDLAVADTPRQCKPREQ